MRFALPRALLAGVCLLPLSSMTGCMFFTTRSTGEELRQDVDQLKKDVELQRTDLDTELSKTKAVTAEATKVVVRNSADLGAQVVELQAAMARLEGQLAEANVALENLRKELGEYRAQTDVKMEGFGTQSGKATGPPIPEDKKELYAEAERRITAGQYDEARRLFRTYLNRYGGDERADNAQLALGESYFREEKYAAAIGEFQKVIDAFPKGDAADDAFLRNGQAFFKLKYCTDARVFLQELIRRFPKSPLAAEARKTLDTLDKSKKNRAKCTS
jgi:tol-pal system protein YbgF